MRQIFSSPRLDNVEAVDAMLREAGIETRMTDARTWNRATKRDFSYSDRDSSYRWPALWVVQSEDYPRARQILRDAGLLLDSTRPDNPVNSYLPDAGEPAAPRASGATRLRMMLFGVALAGAALVAFKLFGNF